ncbi:MAG: serine/threonine protein kinase [Pirellulales bacterium]|nr:serine/threonine protein kinase [Pirellulales bacterium]
MEESSTPKPGTHESGSEASGAQMAEMLDDYLCRIQAGELVDRHAFLEAHPELASLFDFVEKLEDLALVSSDDPVPPDASGASSIPTIGSSAVPPKSAAASVPSDASSSSISVAKPPRDFGNYEILSEVGRGGMGIVFRAKQKTLERVVAIKIIATSLASHEQVRRFHLEAQAAAKLRHPNIVSIHEVGELYGQHYLAMEFVGGPSLAERLQAGPLEVDEAAVLLSAIARAVDHFHSHGVLHRDLKPSNVLLDEAGTPHVADFGLAKFFESNDRTDTGVVAGTPSYMSPEQAYGRSADLGPASDVYSLGAILYELVTGRPPFRGENNLLTLLQVRDREAELPSRLNPKIPRDLELICLKCLEKSPDDRYQSAAGLAEDLEHYLRGESITAKAWGTTHRLWRWARREPALATRFAGVGLFYLVEFANFVRDAVDATFHITVTGVLAAWIIASFFLQRRLRPPTDHQPLSTQAAWCATDVLALSCVLAIAGGVTSPAVLAYPLLIVSAGLWSRVRLVWLMTTLTTVAYGVLVLQFYTTRQQVDFDTDYDRHVYFVLSLAICGCLTAYHVWRVRVLTQYYSRRR